MLHLEPSTKYAPQIARITKFLQAYLNLNFINFSRRCIMNKKFFT